MRQMDAKRFRRMTFGNKAITGGSHAAVQSYARPKTTARVLCSLPLAAAARINSLSDACGRHRDAPSDETARKALLATLPDYATQQ